MNIKRHFRKVLAGLCALLAIGWLPAQFTSTWNTAVMGGYESTVAAFPDPANLNWPSLITIWNADFTGSGQRDMMWSRMDPFTGALHGGWFPEGRGFRTSTGMEEVNDVVVLPSGEYVFVGYTNGSPIGFGGEDAMVVKADQFGNIVWVRRFGGTLDDRANAVIVSSVTGEIVVTGYVTTPSDGKEVWIARISPAGVVGFSNVYTGPVFDDWGTDLHERVLGGSPMFFVGGTTHSLGSTAGIGGWFRDIFILQVDYSGAAPYAQIINMNDPNEIDEQLTNFEPTADGGWIIGGTAREHLGPMFAGPMEACAIKLDPTASVSMYKLWDRASKPEECWVHEQSPGNYIAIGTFTRDNIGPRSRWSHQFNAATGPGWTVVNEFFNGLDDPMRGMLPPNGMWPGYFSFGSTNVGGDINTWTLALDMNGQLPGACMDTVELFISNVGASVEFDTLPIVPVPWSADTMEHVDLPFPDTTTCPPVILPVDTCFAASDPLYTVFSTDPAYVAGVNVWPHKVYVSPGVIITVAGAGTVLDITTSDVVFGVGAGIHLSGGACLRANNSVLRPCEKNDTWLGIDMVSGATAIVDECIFKNAEMALDIQGTGSQAKITNNEFINCGTAVFTFQAGAGGLYGTGITGNTVLVDNEFPTTLPLLPAFFGFHLRQTHFVAYISQNDFIYSPQNPSAANAKLTGIFLDESNASITENKFTNCNDGILVFGNHPTMVMRSIENNEVEFNNLSWVAPPAVFGIRLDKAQMVSVEGNEVKSTQLSSSASTSVGIMVDDCDFVTVSTNAVNGFFMGIAARSTNSSLIQENAIADCKQYGIYALDCNFNFDLNENVITLDGGGTVGILYHFNPLPLVQSGCDIKSNCVHDTKTAIWLLFTGAASPTIPNIRDNFLYNYAQFGLLNNGFTGTVGVHHAGCASPNAWPDADFARNSFITNQKALQTPPFDIWSSPAITMGASYTGADNQAGSALLWSFPGATWNLGGAVTISLDWRCIRGSRANCGSQISNKTQLSGMDLLAAAIVQDYPLQWEAGMFSLEADWLQWVASLPDQDKAMGFAHLQALLWTAGQEADRNMVADAAASMLSGNDVIWFAYREALHKHQLSEAEAALMDLSPSSAEDQDRITLANASLDLLLNPASGGRYSSGHLASFGAIDLASGHHRASARVLLHPQTGMHPGILQLPDARQPEDLGEMLILPVGGDNLSLYPNPGQGDATLEWSFMIPGEVSLKVMNLLGEVVMNQESMPGFGRAHLDFTSLPEGIYLLHLENSEGGNLTQKYVKQ